METKFSKAGQIKPGGYLVVDGVPSRVLSVEKSKPGRHGAAKARIVSVGVFDNKKREITRPVGADVEIPILDKSTAQIVADLGESFQLMDLQTYETFDIKKPEDVENLETGAEVEYIKFGNNMKIVRRKN